MFKSSVYKYIHISVINERKIILTFGKNTLQDRVIENKKENNNNNYNETNFLQKQFTFKSEINVFKWEKKLQKNI